MKMKLPDRNRFKEIELKKNSPQKIILLLLLYTCMFFVGEGIGYLTKQPSVAVTNTGIISETADWGLGFGENGTQPVGNATIDELKQYHAYYMGNAQEKTIYLTFDCGFENGYTEILLDALKKHNVQATFFVVGHYLESAPYIVKRMVADGHTVGNHTYHHYDMNKISDLESFRKELDDVSSVYLELIGEEMVKYYRAPQGKYSIENLEMAQELGYTTFFWSLAYVDWNQDAQPDCNAAIEKLTNRIHPGAVVLLHNTSSTNAAILDELLTKWEEMGYTFATLSDLTEEYQ